LVFAFLVSYGTISGAPSIGSHNGRRSHPAPLPPSLSLTSPVAVLPSGDLACVPAPGPPALLPPPPAAAAFLARSASASACAARIAISSCSPLNHRHNTCPAVAHVFRGRETPSHQKISIL
jgi:hypothetical protein